MLMILIVGNGFMERSVSDGLDLIYQFNSAFFQRIVIFKN